MQVKGIRAKVVAWLLQTRVMLFFLRYIIPNIKFIHAPGPAWIVREQFRTKMQVGDILVSKSRFALTNLIIGGKFSHAAVVISSEPDQIAEMTHKDFDVVGIKEFSENTTRIALLRFKQAPKWYAKQFAKNAMRFQDKRYDAKFTLGVEALYCSELLFQSDDEHRMGADTSDLVSLGTPYLSPDGVYQAKGLQVIFEWEDKPW